MVNLWVGGQQYTSCIHYILRGFTVMTGEKERTIADSHDEDQIQSRLEEFGGMETPR